MQGQIDTNQVHVLSFRIHVYVCQRKLLIMREGQVNMNGGRHVPQTCLYSQIIEVNSTKGCKSKHVHNILCCRYLVTKSDSNSCL